MRRVKGEILVVGGAGYIGSHMALGLARDGWTPVVLDDFSTGHRDAVAGFEIIAASLADAAGLEKRLSKRRFVAVMHFAGSIQVGESVRDPGAYYRNNVANSLNLLTALRAQAQPRLVFSSSAAIFGDPQHDLVSEDHPQRPVNPYGRCKLMVEDMLADFDRAHGLHAVCLRYFNAAGADPGGALGERHEPETHLIPLALRVASGHLPHLTVHGTDYPTPDGTGIRDYIHVCDLCDAHLLALEWLLAGKGSARFNLGNGQGHSVREVIETARRVTGKPIATRDEPRRAGDPPRLVADARKAMAELGWKPRRADLATIIGDAWRWEQRAGAASGNAPPRNSAQ
jgi:UDP-glucose 4-epimerase